MRGSELQARLITRRQLLSLDGRLRRGIYRPNGVHDVAPVQERRSGISGRMRMRASYRPRTMADHGLR